MGATCPPHIRLIYKIKWEHVLVMSVMLVLQVTITIHLHICSLEALQPCGESNEKNSQYESHNLYLIIYSIFTGVESITNLTDRILYQCQTKYNIPFLFHGICTVKTRFHACSSVCTMHIYTGQKYILNHMLGLSQTDFPSTRSW